MQKSFQRQFLRQIGSGDGKKQEKQGNRNQTPARRRKEKAWTESAKHGIEIDAYQDSPDQKCQAIIKEIANDGKICGEPIIAVCKKKRVYRNNDKTQ